MKISTAIFTFSLISAATTPAWAILGVGDLVSDPPVEIATAAIQVELGIANADLASIMSSDALIATSVTTPGDTGLYQGVSQYLDGLDNTLSSAGISQQSMAVLFPGWVPLLPDAITEDSTIVTVALGTYAAAVGVAQAQAADFDGENSQLSIIESLNVGSTGVLGAIQVNTEAVLASAEQTQMLRQLVIALITVEALHDSEELNERAQQKATDAQTFNSGTSPQ